MLFSPLSGFLILSALTFCADSLLEDVDVLFLSALRARLRNLPVDVRCSLTMKAVIEKFNEGQNNYNQVLDEGEIFRQVVDMFNAKKSLARSSIVAYLSECWDGMNVRKVDSNVEHPDAIKTSKHLEDEESQLKVSPPTSNILNYDNIEKDQQRDSAQNSVFTEILSPLETKTSDETQLSCQGDTLKLVREKYNQLFVEHEISLREFRQLYAESIGLKSKINQIEEDNKSLKLLIERDDSTGCSKMTYGIEKLKEELENSFEARRKNEIAHNQIENQLVSELQSTKSSLEQCESRHFELNGACDIIKQNLLSCSNESTKLIAESKEIKSKCDQQVIGLSELVERYKLSAQEANYKKVAELKSKIVSLKNELDIARAKASYCASRFGKVLY